MSEEIISEEANLIKSAMSSQKRNCWLEVALSWSKASQIAPSEAASNRYSKWMEECFKRAVGDTLGIKLPGE